ncbi:MAG: type VI secretion system accessory protein TagJ [Planctomycetota bacterium]
MEALERLNADDLKGSVSAAKQYIRSNPTHADARSLLAQLFCFEADWEKADNQFDTIGKQNSELLVGTKLLRQLVRGEIARRQFFEEGRLPELVNDADDSVTAILDALICIREGDFATANLRIQPILESTNQLQGKVNGEDFVGGRDLDDITAGFFEVLTTNGKFYWLSMDKVIQIQFRGYERLQDRIWRSAAIQVEGFDTEGEVYFPVNYWCPNQVWQQADDQVKLGRKTDWYAATPEAPVRGMGQKSYVFGEKEYSILELDSYLGPLNEDVSNS